MNRQEKDVLKLFENKAETDNDFDDKIIDYINIVNFQMREPASSIFAALPLLAENINKQETEKAMETLQSVYEKSYQLIRGVNNMSIAAKLIGKVELPKETLDLSSIVKSAFEGSKLVLPDYYSLDIDIEQGCVVKGNSKLMILAFFNLIANSFDYRREDNVQVSVKLKSAEGRCVFSYRDNSIGIKPELSQKVFQPYFACNPYNDGEPADKMGLGLYIVDQAVKYAGGTVLLSTEFSEGVNFIMSVPEERDCEEKALKSTAKDFMLNKYSDMFVQLCKYCTLPDLI